MIKKRLCSVVALVGVFAAALVVAGCASGDSTTTVVERVVEPAPSDSSASDAQAPAVNVSDDTSNSSGGDDGSATVPDDLVGERLDVVEDELDSEGIDYKEIGGGTFGIVVKSNWEVCSTRPGGGEVADGTVRLIVDRPGACGG